MLRPVSAQPVKRGSREEVRSCVARPGNMICARRWLSSVRFDFEQMHLPIVRCSPKTLPQASILPMQGGRATWALLPALQHRSAVSANGYLPRSMGNDREDRHELGFVNRGRVGRGALQSSCGRRHHLFLGCHLDISPGRQFMPAGLMAARTVGKEGVDLRQQLPITITLNWQGRDVRRGYV
eukprot:1733886-Amphidinium_carterae.2